MLSAPVHQYSAVVAANYSAGHHRRVRIALKLSLLHRLQDNLHLSSTRGTHVVPPQAQKDVPGVAERIIQRPKENVAESKRNLACV